jgi:hypothetical protein
MAQVLTQEESKIMSEAIFEKLSSRDPVLEKQAVDAVNDFTRTKMREDGFYRRIMPPIPITNDELDRQVDTDKPVKVVDKEPDSPGRDLDPVRHAADRTCTSAARATG